MFQLDTVSGTLFTTEAHAYNNANRFEITITATDPSGLSDYITVALRPSAEADNPVVQGPSSITYPENGTWPIATYTATAANPPRDIEGWLVSVQPGGGDGDFFDIDDDGNLTFTQPPNSPEFVFLSIRQGDAPGELRSTTLSASRWSVQFVCPAGASLHATTKCVSHSAYAPGPAMSYDTSANPPRSNSGSTH